MYSAVTQFTLTSLTFRLLIISYLNPDNIFGAGGWILTNVSGSAARRLGYSATPAHTGIKNEMFTHKSRSHIEPQTNKTFVILEPTSCHVVDPKFEKQTTEKPLFLQIPRYCQITHI